jgi:predicted metalloprotease with PDZ domain
VVYFGNILIETPRFMSLHPQLDRLEAFVHYQVKVANITEHMFSIRMHVNMPSVDDTGQDDASEIVKNTLVVRLPAWIPGSYMLRDFAKNLHAIKSPTPDILIERIDKQSWRISHSDNMSLNEFILEYEVYANDLSVRSAFIDDQYAFFNGTSVFLSVDSFESCKYSCELDTSAYTNKSNDKSKSSGFGLASSLLQRAMPNQSSDSNKPTSEIYRCDDYYEIIDHPVLFGHFNKHCFSVDGYVFHLVFSGDHKLDFEKLEKDLRPIIAHHLALFPEFPCDEYWFITLVCDQGFGGLEHIASTVLQYNRFDLPLISLASKQTDTNRLTTKTTADAANASTPAKLDKAYQQFLSLCSHELFHTWHVKQIKPAVMYRPDLSKEVYTEQMWIYEGFTSFYDDLALARSKVISAQAYVQVLNENFTRLLKTPGRSKQSVAESSFEAWSKFYKQDAGSINHIVSYYNKGMVVALCLDILLRQESGDKVCLDDVMRALWSDYGKPKIGTQNDVISEVCKKHFDIDVSRFIHMATQTTMDLPLPTLLSSIGLRMNLRPSVNMQDKGGRVNLALPPFDIGANFSTCKMGKDNFLRVNNVQSTRAASLAGLQANDLIIAVDGWQADEAKFFSILSQGEENSCLALHVLRDGRLLQLEFTRYAAINDTCDLFVIDKDRFTKWLGLA